MRKKRWIIRRGFALGAGIFACLSIQAPSASASTLVPSQTAVPGDCIPQFAAPLPVFGPAGPIPRVDAAAHPNITVTMEETKQQVLPTGVTYPATYVDPWTGNTVDCPVIDPQKTRIWGYGVTDTNTKDALAPPNWPAVTIETQRYTPTTVTYENDLPQFGEKFKMLDPSTENLVNATGLVQGLISIDKTIHWADPLHVGSMNPCMDDPTQPGCSDPYGAAKFEFPPAVPHLHGAEDSSKVDGGPDAWFDSDGHRGTGYYTMFPTPLPGQAVYQYLNDQEPGTLWFHDHALGATRTNVYSGLEAFYLIRDSSKEPTGLPGGAYDIEMAIQDRQFDTNGQLYFPDGSAALCGTGLTGDPCLNGPPANPTIHPFWIPEFIGDVAIVNGAPWPILHVEPRRYHFRMLDGSNARFYNMQFANAATGHTLKVPVYAVGADDNYLNKPESLSSVFLAPGERIEIIVDFTGLAGKTIDMTNDAQIPYPDGLVPGVDQPGMAKVMRFAVDKEPAGTDESCNPAAGGCTRPDPMVRLTDRQGHLAVGVQIDRVRRLILKEFVNPASGNPQIVLVNNTYWDGMRSPSVAADFASSGGITELPQVGSTELWEIINLTGDAHPMHTHLTQFQILNRQDYKAGYATAWGDAFKDPNSDNGYKCDAFSGDPENPCPGYGPPNPYDDEVTDTADPILVAVGQSVIGGNPALGPYLKAQPTPPAPWESGWKDTAKALPGQVLRLVIRWTPSNVPVATDNTYAGQNKYNFDPTDGPGYVWHCHIIDHEDNEMMRPYKVSN